MAGARQNGIGLLLAAALLLGAAGEMLAQSTTAGSSPAVQSVESIQSLGALSGRLTDLYGRSLDGVTVLLRNDATGAEARTTTGKKGAYRFSGLSAGNYTLEATSEPLGRGRLEGIVLAAGHEERLVTAMGFTALAEEASASEPKLSLILPSSGNDFHPPRAGRGKDGSPSIPEGSGGGNPSVRSAEPNGALASEARTAPISPETPSLPAGSLASETLKTLPLNGHSGRDADLALPATVAPTLEAELALEPFETLSLSGRVGPMPAREMPSILAASIDAVLQFQPMETLALPGRPLSATMALAFQGADPAAKAVTTTLSGQQLQALPATGRRWQDFVLDTPTAVSAAGGGDAVLRGASQASAATTVDGASMGLVFDGQSSLAQASYAQTGTNENGSGQSEVASAWRGGRGLAVSEVAIRSVQTVAGNVESETSRAAGGRLNVETEHGSNGLHGQGFLFDRQNTWGAQNPFTQWVQETTPATATTTPAFTAASYTPPDHETTWGIGAGSQIRRNKLFWFAAVDSYRRNDPGVSTVKNPGEFFVQPTNNEMQVLSARLGLSSANPVVEGLAAYSGFEQTLDGLLGPAPRTAAQWVGFGRLDWQVTERQRLTLEGTGARWSSPGGGLTRISETYGNHSYGSSQASQEWLMGRWEAFLTPDLLVVSQGSVGREVLGAKPGTPSAYEQTLLSGNAWGQLPQIVVDSRYGFTIGNPARFGSGSYPDERLFQAQQSLDWVRGSLLVKTGFDLTHTTDATGLLRNQTGSYSYANVGNFVSDALSFAAFGISGQLNPYQQHNCDQTGTVWTDSTGTLHGLGLFPCYSSFSQTIGPSDWWLGSNDLSGFATAQWQPKKLLVVSAGLRWERELPPPPLSKLDNPELPLTERVPGLGSQWGPRVSLALGSAETHWPVLRLGYGMYFGRTENVMLETALTQTGSLNGDLNIFLRPVDNRIGGGAPPFPAVLTGDPGSVIKPGAVEFAPSFRNPEVHQALAALEETLPSHMTLTASALVSLGRRLPISVDTNFDPSVNPGAITYGVVDASGLGPIKTKQLTVPFYASWPSPSSTTGYGGRLNPDYQQIAELESRANSTYEAAMVKLVRYGAKGLSLHAHYTYAHATDWNPNESAEVAGSDLLDPAHFNLEHGTSNLDVRHSMAAMVEWEAPWRLHNLAGRLGNGWMLSGVGQFHSGLPYTMRTAGSLAEEFSTTGAAITGLSTGMNGSGGDNRVYGVGRNTYRYPAAWKADLRLGKRFNLGRMRELELLAESFNLFNHQNVTQLETTGYYLLPGNLSGSLPTLNFLTGLKPNTTAFGQPLDVNATNFYRERQIQFGLRMRF